MRQFYLAYRDEPNLQQLVGEIPWSHNLVILSRIKDPHTRHYYLTATQMMGWSRAGLLRNIPACSYEQNGLTSKEHNFKEALPQHLAEQANQALKDVYLLGATVSNKVNDLLANCSP